ncbi:MAG: hypothetical protein WAM24_20305, partial [Ignavibacteriaceae bacterium]
ANDNSNNNGNIYTAWGDGGGFGGTNSDGRVSLGFARIQGYPGTESSLDAHNVWGDASPGHNWTAESQATFNGKVGSLICINNTLWAWVNEEDENNNWPNPNTHRLYYSTDYGHNWINTNWVITAPDPTFEDFINFGKNYEENTDGYVYAYGGWDNAEQNIYLARALISNISNPGSWQYYASSNPNSPSWSNSVGARQSVFTDNNGKGVGTWSVEYIGGSINKFIAVSNHGTPNKADEDGVIHDLGVFESDHPWGPWHTIYYSDNWGPVDWQNNGGITPNAAVSVFIVPKVGGGWSSSDRTEFWLVFSGINQTGYLEGMDRFNMVKGKIVSYDITANTTLSAGTYDINSNLTVESGKNLTVQSGAILNFENNKELISYGTLTANGATFQSMSPTYNWTGIDIAGSSSTITNCSIKGGNYGLILENSSHQVSHCYIEGKIAAIRFKGGSGYPVVSNSFLRGIGSGGTVVYSGDQSDGTINNCQLDGAVGAHVYYGHMNMNFSSPFYDNPGLNVIKAQYFDPANGSDIYIGGGYANFGVVIILFCISKVFINIEMQQAIQDMQIIIIGEEEHLQFMELLLFILHIIQYLIIRLVQTGLYLNIMKSTRK